MQDVFINFIVFNLQHNLPFVPVALLLLQCFHADWFLPPPGTDEVSTKCERQKCSVERTLFIKAAVKQKYKYEYDHLK
jgi:hypothetical protein